MKLIAGKINSNWLLSILHESDGQCEAVRAAVAYANSTPKLIELCFEKNIKLTFWGRYDASVPISTNVLKRFLERKSPNQVCKLFPDRFHPKVIWWEGFGAYIGSANMTDNGWFRNVECGIFLTESELIEEGLNIELEDFFEWIDQKSSALTQEIYEQLKKVEEDNREWEKAKKEFHENFDRNRLIPRIDSLVSKDKINIEDRRRNVFLAEWNQTLQIMRDIGDWVAKGEYRPAWITAHVSKGIQADQFLHAYYYNRVKDGNRHPFQDFYDINKKDPEAALIEALTWWKNLDSPPTNEDQTIYEWAPYLKEYLTREKITKLSFEEFEQICSRIHAMRDHALRVDISTYGLSGTESTKDREQCIHLLAKYIWNQKSKEGKTVVDVLAHVLFGGEAKDVPLRLWQATQSPRWRLPHLGISSLGEMVGWAMPDSFPPRNGRTSKALTALGYKVKIHSGG